MKRNWMIAAVAVGALASAACSKGATSDTNTQTAAAPAPVANTTDTSNTSDTTNTVNDSASSNTSGPVASAVDRVQDAAASAVGMASASMPTDPEGFVTAAAISDMYEVQAAKLAEQKSSAPQIQTFAKKMVHDHSGNLSNLKSILKKGAEANLTLPTQLDQRRQGLIDNLNSASASDFDKMYLSQQVSAHQEAETLMRGYSQHGDNGALKQFAATTAPVVQHHLDMAKTLDGTAKFSPVQTGQ